MLKNTRSLIITLFLCNIGNVFADTPGSPGPGIGQIAGNLLVPIGVVSQFMSSASILVGIACLFASVLRFVEYRSNPLARPLSNVIILFIIGIVFLCLPFLYKLAETGNPLS